MELIRYNSYTTILKFKNTDIKEIGVATAQYTADYMSTFYSRLGGVDGMINGGFYGAGASTAYCGGVKQREDNKRDFGICIPQSRNSYDFRRIVVNGEWDALGAVPFLVFNGNKQAYTVDADFEKAHPRSAIGTNGTHLYLITVDGRQTGKPGITLAGLQQLMIDLGLTFGMNLDGGGSTQMVRKNNGNMEYVNSPSETYRPVGNVLYVKESTTRPTIRLGSTGQDVKDLENRLVELGYFYPTGTFSKTVEDAVKDFQRAKGLVVDGVVGIKTWGELFK